MAISAKLELTTENVLTELQRVAFFDPRKLLNGSGGIKPVEEWDDNSAAAVMSLEVDEIFAGKGDGRVHIGLTKKLKLHPKVAALEKLSHKRSGSRRVRCAHGATSGVTNGDLGRGCTST